MGRNRSSKRFPEQVLDLLLAHPGELFSIDKVASELSLAGFHYDKVINAVAQLRKQGYQIESVKDPSGGRKILGYRITSVGKVNPPLKDEKPVELSILEVSQELKAIQQKQYELMTERGLTRSVRLTIFERLPSLLSPILPMKIQVGDESITLNSWGWGRGSPFYDRLPTQDQFDSINLEILLQKAMEIIRKRSEELDKEWQKAKEETEKAIRFLEELLQLT